MFVKNRIIKKINDMESTLHFPPEPSPRMLVTCLPNGKWTGCIWFSSFDLTGQMTLVITKRSGILPPELRKVPFWYFSSPDRTRLETEMEETLFSILKQKKRA